MRCVVSVLIIIRKRLDFLAADSNFFIMSYISPSSSDMPSFVL